MTCSVEYHMLPKNQYNQGNLKGESAVAAILPLHMEGELFSLLSPPSNFFVLFLLPFL